MTVRKEYSSLPLVLAVSGAILLSAAGGWLLPGRNTDTSDGEDLAPDFRRPDQRRGSMIATPPIDIDAELRKARLAADADILVSPPEQNAFYYYARAVAADPQHPVASAEFEALLARISLLVSDHLGAGEFDDAYRLAVRVARERPNHAMVATMRQTLTGYAGELVDVARQHAEAARDDEAIAVLDTVAALPGLSATYVANARNSVAGIQQVRLDAERARFEQAQLAEEQSILEWIEDVRAAIRTGKLLSPPDDNASFHLSSRDSPTGVVVQLNAELFTALIAAGEDSLAQDKLSGTETFLDAAEALGIDDEDRSDSYDALESMLIDAESNRVLGLADFVRLNTEPARYPRRANVTNVTGWVEVVFTVTTEGQTADIAVLQSQPPDMFESAAMAAVAKWTFEPREYRGRFLNQRTGARLVFRLE